MQHNIKLTIPVRCVITTNKSKIRSIKDCIRKNHGNRQIISQSNKAIGKHLTTQCTNPSLYRDKIFKRVQRHRFPTDRLENEGARQEFAVHCK